MTSMRALYTEVLLPSSTAHIRVIDLYPSNKDAALSGTLRTESLDLNAKYEALSYTWARGARTRSVQRYLVYKEYKYLLLYSTG